MVAQISRTRRREIFRMFGGRCAYCGCKLNPEYFHIDHIVARVCGGKNYNNLFPSCPECNHYKGSSSVEEFRVKISNLYYTFHGYMIGKYFGFKDKKPVKFYFEKVMENGERC